MFWELLWLSDGALANNGNGKYSRYLLIKSDEEAVDNVKVE